MPIELALLDDCEPVSLFDPVDRRARAMAAPLVTYRTQPKQKEKTMPEISKQLMANAIGLMMKCLKNPNEDPARREAIRRMLFAHETYGLDEKQAKALARMPTDPDADPFRDADRAVLALRSKGVC